jgi:Ca-activated chloride channel family protein
VIYLAALAAMIFALSRPEATVSLPSNTGTVLLAIDVSGSMFAEDVKPDRMEATKDAVRDFINKQPNGVKIGVVSFSDFGALVAPPSKDKRVALDAVNRLQPQRGTNMGSGLQVALDAILQDQQGADVPPAQRVPGATPTPVPEGTKPPPASIVLLSDWQSNTGPPALRVAQDARAAGVKVYTVGIGTPEGTVLQIQGRSVFTFLDEETLQGVADETGGTYYAAQDNKELNEIYDELARERLFEKQHTEITFAAAGLALILSMAAGALGLLWFNRLP